MMAAHATYTEPEGYRVLRYVRDAYRLLEAGFTAARCLRSSISPILSRGVDEGLIPGPRIIATGNFIGPSGETWDHIALPAVWCFARLFIPSPSGRKRFNVLGAIDAVTHDVLTFTNETYFNSACVCLLLDQIAKTFTRLPISIVLDNASYQRCHLVRNHAAALGIELLFLPAYSPHLNLIERFWRFVRKDCLYAKYYQDFADFKQAIDTCVHSANLAHPAALQSLLSWNFQSFQNVHISAV